MNAAHAEDPAWLRAAALPGAFTVGVLATLQSKVNGTLATRVGSALAVGMFATTLSFLATTPGVWEPSLGGFPALSAVPGQFLLKDVVLLGAALWTLGEALDPHKLERLGRYEVHLDRKLERTLTVLLRLKDLRRGTVEG